MLLEWIIIHTPANEDMGIIIMLKKNLRRILLITAVVLGLLAAGWYGYVDWVSRINGDHPVYLQMGGPQQMTLRWGTARPGAATVHYGLSATDLKQTLSETQSVTNHRLTLKGLQADSVYYYRIRQNDQWLSDEPQSFRTSPLVGTNRATRIWLLGDPGKWRKKVPVRDQAIKWLQHHPRAALPPLDLVLSTGDQAYPNATYAEYKQEFLLPYAAVFKNIPIWPVKGNHDARRRAFYRLFDQPVDAELGGVASGDRHYFSFDYAQVHIVMLDNHAMDLSSDAPMLQWLRHDLMVNKQRWTLVLFHYPPYTRGTYDSDKKHRKDRMGLTRRNILPILEQAGVDMVIVGHSHVYERSLPLRGHYGLSDSFDASMVSTDIDNRGPWPVYVRKPDDKPHTIYMVLGSSGEGNKGRFDHPALPIHSAQAGSVVVDIQGDRLSSRYITESGQVFDRFDLYKPN